MTSDTKTSRLWESVVSGGKSVVRTELLRQHRLSDQQVAARLSVCRQCPGGHAQFKKDGSLLSCGKLLAGQPRTKNRPCGCYLRRKARNAREDCPFGYWPSLEQDVGDKPLRARRVVTATDREAHADLCRRLVDNDGSDRAFADLRESVVTARKPQKRPAQARTDAQNSSTEWLYDYFDRVIVINLDRRSDRMRQFMQSIGRIDWPFPVPERFRAVDGQAVGTPTWWRVGQGAWGCHQSHVRAIESALMDGVERVLILEDDVFFVDDFRSRIARFLRAVPADWRQVYLGGQHLRVRSNPPASINTDVIRPRNVNRTHAYALSRRGMVQAYRWLTDYLEHARHPSHHVDHRFGALHETGNFAVYAPARWLAGQAESHSNIKGKVVSSRMWDGHRLAPSSLPFVAVVGLHKHATTTLARVLHELGVHFGDRVSEFEAKNLIRLCEQACPYPECHWEWSPEQRRHHLRSHIQFVQTSASRRGQIAGGKHQLLGAMIDDLAAVCGSSLKLIVVDEPIGQEVAAETNGSCRAGSEARVLARQRWLQHELTRALETTEHALVTSESLRQCPRVEIRTLTSFLALTTNAAQIESAIDCIRADHDD